MVPILFRLLLHPPTLPLIRSPFPSSCLVSNPPRGCVTRWCSQNGATSTHWGGGSKGFAIPSPKHEHPPFPGNPCVAAFLRSGGRVTELSLSPAAGAMGFILAAKHMTKKLIVFFLGGWFLPLFVSSPPPGSLWLCHFCWVSKAPLGWQQLKPDPDNGAVLLSWQRLHVLTTGGILGGTGWGPTGWRCLDGFPCEE